MEALPARKAFTPTMESFSTSIVGSTSPPFQDLRRNPKSGKPTSISPKRIVLSLCRERNHPSRLPKPHHLVYPIIGSLTPLPSFASESAATVSSADKINLESIVIAVDDFFNRNPFFVAGCTFIWLVVVPVVEYYVSKYKYVSAIDAFRKLRDDPDAELLDIRERRSVAAMDSPDLKLLKKKGVVKAEFVEGKEEEFVRKVLGEFEDPRNTVLCILDNFDGNSMKVAELLFKNGFKEAYAIKGGVLGEKGWKAIQETLLPPSFHMRPKKKRSGEPSPLIETNGAVGQVNNEKPGKLSSADDFLGENQVIDSGNSYSTTASTPKNVLLRRSLSPYPNYPDLKPPSSPTPSSPKH